MIELTAVSKTYRGASMPAVENLTIRVEPGEIFGFLGPNGAGKTTTIKMMTGLLRADSGSVVIAGRDIRTDPLGVKASLGFVPDTPVLYDRMSGRRFLSFYRRRLFRAGGRPFPDRKTGGGIRTEEGPG